MPEKLQFRVSSALKDVIGKDLITDDFVAIFELVKNSFDAFANMVTIKFVFEENKLSKIFIIDDGKGMSKQDLINKWLFVGFSAKKEGTEDKVKRIYSGYKGIGRFSCDRLGETLKIQSKSKYDNNIHCVKVNWNDFEKNSKNDFIDINVEYSEQNNFSLPSNKKKNSNGVILEIGKLRDEDFWNRNKLIKLRRSLQKLIDPINSKNSIIIECDNELKNDQREEDRAIEKNKEAIIVNGVVRNTIFKVLENKTTKLIARITSNGILQVELIDRGMLIYKTEESIIKNYPELTESDFYAEISFLNTSAKYTFTQRMGIRPIKYGSIFLLRNGFRVYPIGEETNDYWGFDSRKQQGFARYLGSRELLGFVKISGDENKFRESSSRNQGLIQTKAAIELKDCVKKCLVKLEAYVVDITWKDKLDKDHNNFERMNLVSNRLRIIELIEKLSNSKNIKVVDYNKNIIAILNEKITEYEPSIKRLRNIAVNLNNNDLLKQISNAEKSILKSKEAQQKAEKIAEQEKKARLQTEKKVIEISKEKEKIGEELKEEVKRNIFLTSSTSRDKDLLEGFIHQIILYASDLKANLQNVLQFPKKLENVSLNELQNMFSILFEINEKIISTSRFATTANFRLKSSMITEDLNGFIFEYLKNISPAYNKTININTYTDSNKFEIIFNPIELGMTLENFINNSKKAKASKISFSSSVKTNIFEIIIEDNGNGLNKNIRDRNRIFEKGFTRTGGSGLGLHFCKNQIESLGGELKLAVKQPERGTKFIIKVAR